MAVEEYGAECAGRGWDGVPHLAGQFSCFTVMLVRSSIVQIYDGIPGSDTAAVP